MIKRETMEIEKFLISLILSIQIFKFKKWGFGVLGMYGHTYIAVSECVLQKNASYQSFTE